MDLTTTETKTSKWVADGMEAVKLSFVHKINDLGTVPEYEPEFVYQHFGQNETIFGYENLKVTINYADASLHFYPQIEYTSKFNEDPDIQPDDIMIKLKEQQPSDQLDMLVESKAEFNAILEKQKSFNPIGELIEKFASGESNLEIYKVAEPSQEIDHFLGRAQYMALFYIDAASYTDVQDERWLHYLIYENCDNGEGDGSTHRKFAGYASLYRYYAYPDKIRPRVAQILLLPQYRGQGTAAKFLQTIYKDLWATSNILDIAVEDPADAFIFLRDYVDCCNCLALTQFSPQNLRRGFSDEMRLAALEKYKINRKQARRVYEILRFRVTNPNDAEDLKSYRLDVKRRLHAPMRKSEKDKRRLNCALTQEELTQAAVNEKDLKETHALLEQLYQTTVKEYEKTVARLEKYPTIF
ncbi:unnamed protein product [Caenorhabditis angaria]|uniref:Histone acetyltransferase type B catalytic subunit n=1 Tax=Caenorhabditis angaria TaxID=860376 RepID=A0A9P1N023_9PELO|nr:unnamed protein product [Caenorhabditis angaria]